MPERPGGLSAHMGSMTTQLTLQGLLDALGSVEQNATLMLASFGGGANPGTLFRHRPFVDGLSIEPSLNRAHSTSVAQFAGRLRELGLGRKLETYKHLPFEDRHPAGPDTPMWAGTQHELSFYAVTGVEMVKGFAVIRTADLAPEQGPSIQRISDEEAINRRRVEHLQRMGEDIAFAPHIERYLLRALPDERSRALLSLEEARQELATFEVSLQAKKDRVAKLEHDAARNDYLLGIRDDLPGAEVGCNGVCYRASDVGVSVPGDPVAYPHESCPEHGSGS